MNRKTKSNIEFNFIPSFKSIKTAKKIHKLWWNKYESKLSKENETIKTSDHHWENVIVPDRPSLEFFIQLKNLKSYK